MSCRVENIISQSAREVYQRHANGTTSDIVETILYADARSGAFVLDGVECLRGATERQTMENVWRFVRGNITYRADRPGHERVKSPGALFAEGKGDCKSFSIALGAILRALGYQYKYRFVAYSPGDVTHVYVIATGQRQYILDAVHNRFDEEVNYYRKQDIKPRRVAVNGVSGFSIDFSKWLVLGGVALLAYSIWKK